MKLTVKQKRFADEYIESGNATQSAIKAGYSKKTAQQMGNENLLKPVIKNYIDERMSEMEAKRIMSATEAVQLLTSIARGEVKETVVVATPVGVETTEKEADLKTRITATKEILKRYPGSDKLAEQQLRKAIAEADILEAKAKELQGGGDNQDDMLRGIADSLGGVK
ncbi:terminase small subunit [Fructobacillus cardui]|uniref:terminase small subunit n=1 Tax=Fructobacillus cardui TaxID=2893170 RepID=UPI00200AA11E|nr:terminase small subunit [Fructobacillus cardui]MCK8628103.1 terminase small subunit [Fructobacillus cardui]